MKFETLEQNNKKKYIVASLVIIAIALTITYVGTRAKYRVTSSVQLATGTITYTPSDLEITSIKLQTPEGNYEETENIPIYGYQLNNELSECIVKGEKQEVEITYEEGKIGISNISKKGNKCSIYFDQLFKGSGTEDNPYLLSNIEDLVELSKDVNKGNTYSEKHFKLERTLDFNNSANYKDLTSTKYGDYNGDGTVNDIKTELTTSDGFIPIGSSYNQAFQGIFDGNNQAIQNIHEENTNKNKILGLFGVTIGATVKNLGVKGDYNIKASNDSGIIIGQAYQQTKVERCYSEGSIFSDFGSKAIGGIVGAMINDGTISDSYNLGNLTNGYFLGGLVGYVHTNATLTIENSYNKGTITNNLGANAGGLVGIDNAESSKIIINNSHNEGDVIGNNTVRMNLGGLVAFSKGSLQINRSYNNASVINQSKTNSQVGGFLGNNNSGTVNVNNSYNLGNVTGGWRTGGIIGIHYKGDLIINKTYNSAAISSDSSSSGSILIGGIIGYSYGGGESYTSKTIILNTYNKGDISGARVSAGLFGQASYNSAIKVINSYNIGSIKSTEYSLGIGRYVGDYPSPVYINNVYSTGTLESTIKNSIANISGDNASYSITNAYYDNTTAGSNITSDGLQGMNLSDMKSQNFVNTLNNNIKNISLESIDPLLKDYKLSSWSLGPDGYPILNN